MRKSIHVHLHDAYQPSYPVKTTKYRGGAIVERSNGRFYIHAGDLGRYLVTQGFDSLAAAKAGIDKYIREYEHGENEVTG